MGPYFLPNWSGGLAGVNALDRVAVNGRSLRDRGELYDLVKSAPAGSRFDYRVIRNSQTLEFAVPSMILSLHDWFLSFGIYVVLGIAFLIIGAAPSYFHATSPAALPLCFMVMAVFVWFEATFDFMTAGVLPKEMRIFALTLTQAQPFIALLLKTGKPLRGFHPIYLACIYGIALSRWVEQLDVFRPVRRLGLYLSRRIRLYLRRRVDFLGCDRVDAAWFIARSRTVPSSRDLRRSFVRSSNSHAQYGAYQLFSISHPLQLCISPNGLLSPFRCLCALEIQPL